LYLTGIWGVQLSCHHDHGDYILAWK